MSTEKISLLCFFAMILIVQVSCLVIFIHDKFMLNKARRERAALDDDSFEYTLKYCDFGDITLIKKDK